MRSGCAEVWQHGPARPSRIAHPHIAFSNRDDETIESLSKCMVSIDSCQFPACGQRVLGRVGILACPVEIQAAKACAPFPPSCPACTPRSVASVGFPVAFSAQQTQTNPKRSHCPDPLQISYLLYIQSDGWIPEVFKWVRFAKKLFSPAPLPPPVSQTPSGPIVPCANSGGNKILPRIPNLPKNRTFRGNRNQSAAAAR